MRYLLLLIAVSAFALPRPEEEGQYIEFLCDHGVYFSIADSATGVTVSPRIQVGDEDSSRTYGAEDSYIEGAGVDVVSDSIFDAIGTYWDPTLWVVDGGLASQCEEFFLTRIAPFSHYRWITISVILNFQPSIICHTEIDTLHFRTVGDTKLTIAPRMYRDYGFSSTGAVVVTGKRSAGMVVYNDNGLVVSPETTQAEEFRTLTWTYQWTGLGNGVQDTLRFWGLSDVGASSDTVTLYAFYRQIGGVFRPK